MLSFVIIVLSASAVFAGGDADEEAGPRIAVNPAGTFPIVDEKITMTAFIPTEPWMGGDYQDNDFIRYLNNTDQAFGSGGQYHAPALIN